MVQDETVDLPKQALQSEIGPRRRMVARIRPIPAAEPRRSVRKEARQKTRVMTSTKIRDSMNAAAAASALRNSTRPQAQRSKTEAARQLMRAVSRRQTDW